MSASNAAKTLSVDETAPKPMSSWSDLDKHPDIAAMFDRDVTVRSPKITYANGDEQHVVQLVEVREPSYKIRGLETQSPFHAGHIVIDGKVAKKFGGHRGPVKAYDELEKLDQQYRAKGFRRYDG